MTLSAAYLLVLTMCNVTVPTKNPFHQPTFTNCTKKVYPLPSKTLPGVSRRKTCFMLGKDVMRHVNNPIQRKIIKAEKFPYKSTKKVVRRASCLKSKAPQIA